MANDLRTAMSAAMQDVVEYEPRNPDLPPEMTGDIVSNWREVVDAALEAIRAAGPTEAMVEAGALAVLTLHCAGNPMWEPDEAFERADVANQIARACLSAALAAKET
jgi:hypothetical protein